MSSKSLGKKLDCIYSLNNGIDERKKARNLKLRDNRSQRASELKE
jgi:hypothetical protein